MNSRGKNDNIVLLYCLLAFIEVGKISTGDPLEILKKIAIKEDSFSINQLNSANKAYDEARETHDAIELIGNESLKKKENIKRFFIYAAILTVDNSYSLDDNDKEAKNFIMSCFLGIANFLNIKEDIAFELINEIWKEGTQGFKIVEDLIDNHELSIFYQERRALSKF